MRALLANRVFTNNSMNEDVNITNVNIIIFILDFHRAVGQSITIAFPLINLILYKHVLISIIHVPTHDHNITMNTHV